MLQYWIFNMDEKEPNLIDSSHSKPYTKDGITVEVCIYCLDQTPREWTLEVVNFRGTSIIWDQVFETDDEALSEFQRTVREDGMKYFVEDGNVVQFPGNRS